MMDHRDKGVCCQGLRYGSKLARVDDLENSWRNVQFHNKLLCNFRNSWCQGDESKVVIDIFDGALLYACMHVDLHVRIVAWLRD
jgi:hypothetical protein